MSARNTKRRNSDLVSAIVHAAAIVYAGTLVTRLTASGDLVTAGTASAGNAVGVAEDTVTGDGVLTVNYHRGTFQFDNSSSGDLIALGDIGAPCFIVDGSTVAKTSSSGTRAVAGTIIDVDSAGVWVAVGSVPSGIVDSIANLNAWATALATKLNADAGVTDTNYDTNAQA